ncbi:MAG: rhodanese-like domain-containing protein [Caldimonas sp.]
MKQLSAPELLALATSRAADEAPVVLLDVREPWEVGLASIEVAEAKALFIPMRSVADLLGELDPAQPVVCICHHGARSAQVVAFLERSGFESAYNLAGGIDAWSLQVDAAVPRY